MKDALGDDAGVSQGESTKQIGIVHEPHGVRPGPANTGLPLVDLADWHSRRPSAWSP